MGGFTKLFALQNQRIETCMGCVRHCLVLQSDTDRWMADGWQMIKMVLVNSMVSLIYNQVQQTTDES